VTPSNATLSPPLPRLAYLVSQYPAFSHTFVLREVLSLRRLGFEIHVASINPPDRSRDTLTSVEQSEAQATFYVKDEGLRGAFQAAKWALRHYPAGFFRSLLFAWRLGGLDLGKLIFNHFYWIEALILGRWMEERGLSHLHIHFATPAATVGLIANQAFPIDYSLTVHGPDEFYDAPGFYLREKVVHAKFVLCISHFARSQLMKLTPSSHWDKLHVCRLGVDPEAFKPGLRQTPNECFTIVSVGRLADAKGHMILLRAIKRLSEAGRIVRLFLIGGGPLDAELKNWVCSNGLRNMVTLSGPIDQDHIRDYYSCADCFALASFAEGIPVVLMEAMAMAIPCVTTQITGIPELIHDERDGLLVAAGDEIGLAAALGLLMDDPALCRKLGEAGRARVCAEYNLDRNMRVLAEKFKSLLPVTLVR
jgi:colanic acid/amylovoran biosynthesis glycosyltransferase